ncbi:MAG: hypothetical protein ACREB5_00710 [Sphingomonadaceae bacterium]
MLLAAPALAQEEASAPGEVIALTPEQKEEVLNRAGTVKVEPVVGELPVSGVPQVHGEVGFMIGTGGMRGAYGTADVPLGSNFDATVSFETMRGPRR